MTAESKGRDLFIVDNSISGWTGLKYLEEWTDISKSFDIATGYFEIGSLLALDGKWQRLKKIRILMGSETTHRTRGLLLGSVGTTRPLGPVGTTVGTYSGACRTQKHANPL